MLKVFSKVRNVQKRQKKNTKFSKKRKRKIQKKSLATNSQVKFDASYTYVLFREQNQAAAPRAQGRHAVAPGGAAASRRARPSLESPARASTVTRPGRHKAALWTPGPSTTRVEINLAT